MRQVLAALLLVLAVALLAGCQSFPSGRRLAEFRAKHPEQQEVSAKQLYRYYAMCRAVWRRYDQWGRADWQLDYFYKESTDTLGLIIPEEDRINIMFRSSRAFQSDSDDFKYNRRFFRAPLPFLPESGITAHRGFIQKYMSIRDTLLEKVAASGKDKFVLVGHSGGAAINTIAFIDLKTLFPQAEISMYTFGSIRVVNRKGAKWFRPYRENIIRVVNGRDPFPSLPPPLFGYRHVGQLIRIGRRPWYQIFSGEAHHPGYQKVLEQMLREQGIDPKALPVYQK